MDLLNAFDTPNHDFLIAKLYVKTQILDYLSNRRQKTKNICKKKSKKDS